GRSRCPRKQKKEVHGQRREVSMPEEAKKRSSRSAKRGLDARGSKNKKITVSEARSRCPRKKK
ncbi:hypothetical protein, partial [Bacillus sp. MUM 116]|uniref:hypothetical protein n=1 Tax=Bacillus sp. MUM 116 TaxID=1678002 RepID=UPI001C42FA0A